jgi:hypothetical protein
MKTKTKLIFIIALILAVLLAAIPVNAQTILMANPEGTGTRDVAVYWANGTFYGLYNDTSLITINTADSYIFTMKPQNSNPLNNPGDFLETAFAFVMTYIIPLTIMVFLAAVWLGRR